MKVFILFALLVCLTGCSAQKVKDVKKGLFPEARDIGHLRMFP